MKRDFNLLAVAAAVLAVPLFAYSQTTGHREATRMVRVRAELLRPLDALKEQSGSEVQVKLRQKVTLTDGTVLPDDTTLVGQVTVDDMQQRGVSKLALRFDQARLKDGTVVRIKATIVGFYGPEAGLRENFPPEGDMVPNSWTDGTLQVEQINVVGGVDLHSKISSSNSGVFVSTKKDVKLKEGSEIQFAIGPDRGQ
jgi:predicted DNA-binding antitoxin AbrB/MazE fold protein